MDLEIKDVEDYITAPDPQNHDTGADFENDTIYKRWHKRGFISIRPWLDAGRFVIDIGAINPDTKAKVSNTVAYVKAVDLATYLQSVVNGSATDVYPKGGANGNVNDLATDESFVVYGGSNFEGRPTSRIFKIHHWGSYDRETKELTYEDDSFVWKIGLFEAGTTSSGAFIAKRDKIIQADMIKVSRQEMHRIEYCIRLAMINYASNNPHIASLNPG